MKTIEFIISEKNNYKNPYVALFNSLESRVDSAILNLIDFTSSNTKENINETFFNEYSGDYDQYTIKAQTILETACNLTYKSGFGWESGTPQKMFQKLFDLGLDFTKEVKLYKIPRKETDFVSVEKEFEVKIQASEFTKDNVFGELSLEEKNILLLKFAYSQMNQEDFNNRVKKYRTLHNAVQKGQKQLIHFLIKDCQINPNLLDQDNNPPLFSIKDYDVIEELSKYEINWFQTNVLGKDCINIFTNLNNKDVGKKLIDFAQKKMTESIENNKTENVDENFVYERIKANLLEMVKTDKTKKELSDFIKKYKITNLSEIKDENGSSLAQLCLEKNNWARYDIFKEEYGLEYQNKHGVSTLEIMLSKTHVPREEQAAKIINEILISKSFKNNRLLGVNLFKNATKTDAHLSLPSWYFSRRSTNQELFFFKAITENNEQMTKDFQSELEIGKNNTDYKYYSSSEGSSLFTSFLILSFDKLYNNSTLFEHISIKNLFENDFSYKTSTDILKIKDKSFSNIKNVISLCKKYNYFSSFNVEKFEEKLETKIVEQLIIGYKNNTEKEFNENAFLDFINKNKEAFNYLINIKSSLSCELLTNDFMENLKKVEKLFKNEDKEMFTGINYLFLNKALTFNQTKDLNTKKMKI